MARPTSSVSVTIVRPYSGHRVAGFEIFIPVVLTVNSLLTTCILRGDFAEKGHVPG